MVFATARERTGVWSLVLPTPVSGWPAEGRAVAGYAITTNQYAAAEPGRRRRRRGSLIMMENGSIISKRDLGQGDTGMLFVH
jgi:hypothetical protein